VGEPEAVAPLDHLVAGLQVRSPDEGRPCVDRGAGAIQAADDRPFTEPNPLLPLHRAVRLPQPEPRRAWFYIHLPRALQHRLSTASLEPR
jgi:hypothetical protein